MGINKKILCKLVVYTAAIGLQLNSSLAIAGAVIQYGDTILGVNNEGHLNFTPSNEGLTAPAGFVAPLPGSEFDGTSPDNIPFGLYRNGVGDATSPGCLCEGWGIALTTSVGRFGAGASIDNSGISGISGGEFGSTSSTATSLVHLSDAEVSVRHAFGPSLADGVFQASVTIRNNSLETITDLVYRRAMDWDIPNDEFNEFVTHGGVVENLESVGGNVRFASDNGFASLDPTVNAGWINFDTVNSNFEDNGPTDHGSVFDFAFGDLAAGDTRTFNIFYGSTATEADALSAISFLGANVYSLGQYSGIDTDIGNPLDGTPATFLFAFGGVGGVEPGTNPANPILPFVPAPGEFVFTEPEPANWFDPPFSDGFEYELTGGAVFDLVTTPDASYGFGDVDVVVDGVVVATLNPGDTFDFSTLATAVSSFKLVGLDMLLDIADPDFATAFPVFLDWTGSASTLLMSAIIASVGPVDVPEPQVLFLLAFAAFILINRKKMMLN
ncbi:hypothetical protein N7931_04290 [Catenovulum sp. 2E275]|uniref:hypothetical protein n=1 Tax=Catenovulum sp. 2E275 TaxID=2980497 RepID=UPI0021D2489E|nr:hypothetical protein [Catenovulum sp. 2E275]MCU4674849.1 hypothetical protein [Catenovulum sp. 2E275]